MNIVGPSRLILIHSGKYDYGEIELVDPLHLIGPNNVGKTSLIAVLQFLYIDDQRSMHFSRDLPATRKYYFPDQNSYILFECLTATGYQVVGVQGLGPIRGYEFQRFAYEGVYDPADYLDDERCVRPPEEIRSRLAARDFRLLEPRHLRAALTGLGENRGVNLGLVPIRQRDHYERFRAVFGNLLRLAHLRQHELKEFLLEIHQGEFQQRAIDLEAGYSSQYSKVRRQAAELSELRTIADEVRRVLELAAERDRLRRELPGLWQEITRAHAEKEEAFNRQEEKINQRLAELRAEKQAIAGEIAGGEKEQREVNQAIGKIEGAMERHRKEAEEFRHFLVDFEESRCNLLETKIDRISASLGQAADISLPRTRARIAGLQSELAGLEKQRQQFSRLAAAAILRMLHGEEVQNVFKLINPALLGLVQGEDEITLRDEEKIKEALELLLSRMGEGVYEDERIRLVLAALEPPDLSPYRDADVLDSRIEERKKDLERELRLCETAENAEPAKREKEKLRQEWKEVSTRLARYENHLKDQREFEKNSRTLDALTSRLAELDGRMKEFKSRQASLEEAERSMMTDLQSIAKKRDALVARLRKLTGPDSAWPLQPFSHDRLDIESLLEIYERKSGEQSRTSQRFNDSFQGVNRRTYDRYLGEDESATLANLQAEVDAIEERENAVQELWKSLVAGLQSSFKGLNRDLQTLTMRIDELNRRLGRISISNLARLRLILREHPEWTRRIKTLIDAELSPLFASQTAVGEAHDQLGEMLRKHQRVELADLFDLHFEVTSVDGQIRRYPHLDSIESNGTTITIKVLINLLLLKGLLGDREVAVPFYLDEASSLDRENLVAIVQEARKMGFVAVLASPEAMEAADLLYFLRERGGRIMLDPKTALVRIERKDEDGG